MSRRLRPEQLDLVEARTLVAIALYHRQHGEGPPWSKVAAAAGWPTTEMSSRLGRLRYGLLVEYSRKRGSLRVTPRGLEAALARLAMEEAP